VEELTGGRINVLNHMTEVLKNHPRFTWSNYGVLWECDHIIPFKTINKFIMSDYFRINNWRNLRPRTPDKNKRQNRKINNATQDDDDSVNAEAEEESQSLNAPGEQESVSY
jgi:hypothetical protein